jgi:beta-lactamase superfamily II metal-dependent hydrolase
MILRVFDVEHGQCALIELDNGKYFMIDVGHNGTTGWKPGPYLKSRQINQIDLLAVTNYDGDHVSGLIGLRESVGVKVLLRNKRVSLDQLRAIKAETGGMGHSIRHLMHMAEHVYTAPAEDLVCPGFSYKTFAHSHDDFQDTNNLSLVVFVELHGIGILFPGDLEVPGWTKMLSRPDFREVLKKTSIFVASHHGRRSGFCKDVFEYQGQKLCQPYFVVVSDKSKEFGSQETHADYHAAARGGQFGSQERFVLTTRSDGRIRFTFEPTTWYATNE